MESKYVNDKRVFAAKNKNELIDFIADKKKILIAINAEKILLDSNEITNIINSNIGYPDGIGAVLALRRKGVKSIKIAGAEFWLDIIKHYSSSKSFYLIGSSENVIQQTVIKLEKDFNNVNIVGYRNGYLKPEDEKVLVKTFKEKKPDIIFVAMGSPKQEFLMQKFLNEYPALYMGLGGSFDVYSGNKKRAPKLYQKLGLEWFYRLLQEPSRIFRQLVLIKFFFKIIFNKL